MDRALRSSPTLLITLAALCVSRGGAAECTGTVADIGGGGIAGATVIAVGDVGNGDRLTTVTDANGRFAFEKLPAGKTPFPSVYLVALKEGYGPAIKLVQPDRPGPADITLSRAAAFDGVVKDGGGRPVAGAEVQAGSVHRSAAPRGGSGASWGHLPPAAVRGSPAESYFFATTDAAGRFHFSSLPERSELAFRVTAAGFAEQVTGPVGPNARRYVVKADAAPAELVLGPEAVIRGRVTSAVAGVTPDVATIKLDGTKSLIGFHRTIKPAADGRFTAAGLPAGPIRVAVEPPADAPATAADEIVTTEAGKASEVELTIIAGVAVTGRVVVKGTNEPAAGVRMATLGAANPTFYHFAAKPTDAAGRFTVRIPPGHIRVMVWRGPGGYRDGGAEEQRVEIPSDAAKFELPKLFELSKVIDVAAALTGPIPPADPAAGPIVVADERRAAAVVRDLGGWYVLDAEGHVVEVNMVYHGEGRNRENNRVTDSDGGLRASAYFPRLKKLYVHGGQATDAGLATIAGLRELEVLIMWDARTVTDAGVRHLARLPNLQKVHISASKIGDGSLAVFGRMPSIQELSLQGNAFTDAGLAHLAGMVQLRSLWVGRSKLPITDAGVRHLAKLTSLEQLDLGSAGDDPAIGDAAVESFLGMKSLRQLYLGKTRMTADGVGRLLTLPELKDLSLTSTAIGDAARVELAKARPDVKLQISIPAKKP